MNIYIYKFAGVANGCIGKSAADDGYFEANCKKKMHTPLQ